MRVLWSAVLFVPSLMIAPGRERPHVPRLDSTALERGGTISDSDQTQLIELTQKLLDGIATADTALWDRLLTEDCLMMDPDGVTRTKAQLLTMMRPLPSGYAGTLRVEHPQVSVHGATAVLSYDALEREEVYGQPLVTQYHTMDTYIRTVVGWRLFASQSLIVPRDPTPAVVDSLALNAYVGRYSLAPAVIYEITRAGNQLFGQWSGGQKEELIPMGPATFFRRGVRGERFFTRDSTGTVTNMVDRRDNNDLVWKRMM